MPITELRIEGLRTIDKIRLRLDGLTVLIGENGSGKSSILEACEILRRATGPRFMDEFYSIHGGLTALLRQGAPRLLLGFTANPESSDYESFPGAVKGDVESIEYNIMLTPHGSFASIEETVRMKIPSIMHGLAADKKKRKAVSADGWIRILERRAKEVFFVADGFRVDDVDGQLPFVATKNVSQFADGDRGDNAAQYVAWYLTNILVHLPFEVAPAWAARALDRKSALRSSALLTPAKHLEKLGLNLASAYHALKNTFGRSHWNDTLAYIRLGLGERIDDVVTWADPGGGNIGLSVKLIGLDRPIPSSQLSDGMLSYLAFVALFRLHTTKPSLVAFDEPDLHLHPALLMRVLDMFDSMAWDCPVLLATHSDALLDGLKDPAKSVVLCELDERGATSLVRPDPEALKKWLERYRGLGDIQSAGHGASVLTKMERG